MGLNRYDKFLKFVISVKLTGICNPGQREVDLKSTAQPFGLQIRKSKERNLMLDARYRMLGGSLSIPPQHLASDIKHLIEK